MSKIKLFLTDVDGVLTDGGMYYTELGDEFKRFSVYDGMGLQIIQSKGVKTGIITSESRDLNRRRSQKIGLDYYFQGIKNKLEVALSLCEELNITLDNVAFIGDDVNDLDLLQKVGIAACPSNARKQIKNLPKILQINAAGGYGAVREFIEYLIDEELIASSSSN